MRRMRGMRGSRALRRPAGAAAPGPGGRWCSSLVALGAGGVRRPPRRPRPAPADQARRGGPRVADSPAVREALRDARPERRAPAVRRAGAHRHRRRLRRGDGPRPHPLHPPGPGPDRQAVPRRPRRRARRAGLHPEVHRHARPLDARGGAGPRRRPGRRAGLGRHHRRPRSTQQLRDDLLPIGARALARARASGWLGAWLVSRRLRRQTHGLGEREITRMYEYYGRAARRPRGAAAARPEGRVQLVNDEARRLLDLPDDVVGRPLDDLGLPPGLVAAAVGDTAEPDDIYLAGERVLVVSSAPAAWDGREVGAVVTLRDHTELQAVTGELDVVRGLTESLRSQNHEAANRLHTVVSLIEMGRADEAVELRHRGAPGRPAAHRPGGRRGRRPGGGRAAARQDRRGRRARRRAARRRATLHRPTPDVDPRDLVTVLGNLVDNAFDAVGRAGGRAAGRACDLVADADGRSRSVSATAAPASTPRPREACSSAAGRPRPRRRPRASAWPSSAQVARRHGGERRGRPLAARRRASSRSTLGRARVTS